ncbi:hypothetical protein P691DRAFT_764335 [Macrolepiota fuliginosa MF-IS2]|uniref:Uncharacterized protein n=1 Tax=Macrolepiota fuliginosa MF-IS2 TaxID=1400762 RepID=A0A9P6BXR6_9AGAR|nr:hypothetical protein P691DRAFT_764335 [Macrolepiota fuliginosa MF-IS2]
MVQLANLPVHICNGSGHRGTSIVGWLPIVEGDEDQKGHKHFVNLKWVVWHDSFVKLLQSLAKRKDVLILLADYEEQSVMALIQGFRGLFPCPICLVPAADQTKIITKYELHNQENTKNTILTAFNLPKIMAEDVLKQKGLWLVQTYITKLGSGVMVSVNNQAAEAPQWCNIHHFNKVLNVHFTDASKFENIVKLSLYITYDLFPHKSSTDGYLLLCLIHHYLNINMYSALDVHIEHTIEAGEAELKIFEQCLGEYITKTASNEWKKLWDFVKLHILSHLFPDIQMKGVSKNANTQPSEQKHHELKNAWHQTNFQDTSPQILQKVAQIDAMNFIQACVEAEEDMVEEPDSSKVKLTDFERVILGSAQQHTMFLEAEDGHDGMVCYKNFASTVNNFFKQQVAAGYEIEQQLGETTEYVQSYFSYTEYAFIKCSNNFHGQPQHDSIMYISNGKTKFGVLQMVFTVKLGETIYPLCYVQPYKFLNPHQWTQRDKDLQLLHLWKQGLNSKSMEVIFCKVNHKGSSGISSICSTKEI